MMRFDRWSATGRVFSPADAEGMFGWSHPREDIAKVFVYSGPIFIEIMFDGLVIFGGVAMEDLQMAEEAAYDYYRTSRAA